MGGTLSIICGLQASDSDHDLQPQYQSKDCARNFDAAVNGLGRSLSSASDLSVASILSNSEQLVPDAYLPKDIQVLSQRRQHHGRHHRTASRSSFGYYGKNLSSGSSKVSNLSSRKLGGVRVVRDTTVGDIPSSVNNKNNFDIKTASSSFGYSDDDDTKMETSERLDPL
ncbi:hypothetical protein CCR75_004608 [Bremia lactucae]|uniref:Uncharacterized protein n=1 Tax=Bremia lactucae TaxID=4779 RepID=A0A976P082_BRELC|nr:hypothetical protein CCR75_004608 [Bremia lactucae]